MDKNYSSEFLKNHACIRFDGEQWLELRSSCGLQLELSRQGEHRFVTREDWPSVKAFVESPKRVPLVGHLLSIAEKLSNEGHSRAALIEAVSALEVGLHEFAEKTDSEKLLHCKDIITGFPNLNNDIEHLGLGRSVNYLFPLIVKEGAVSRDTLEQCQEAVVERNNVVHNGQRVVKREKLLRYMRGIRSFLSALDVV